MTEQIEQNNAVSQLTAHYEHGSHWIITANHSYIPYAQEELRRRYGQLKSQIFVPGEVALMELPETATEIWRHQVDQPAMFIRDMFPVMAVLSVGDIQTEEQAAGLWDKLISECDFEVENGAMVSVHLRRSKGKEETDPNQKPLFEAALQQRGFEPVLRAPQWIWSIFIHDGNIYTGIASIADQGSDWPGGAIRFQREEGQISRAKFKLLEAEQAFGLSFASYRNALDIGAAPGGWTSLLLERGVHVTAVDPAKMHESLQGHPQLQIIQRNAGEVAFEPNEFDLLVCDMSWSPKHTAQLVIELLEAVMPGGTVIVTVKLMHKKPLQTIRECMAMFEEHLHILKAKQLFHNRDEITLYMMKY
ncbi:SAM-dependent methyltransferase [Paenibacillus marinisediminis]